MNADRGLHIAPGVEVGADELEEQFIRSSGPGGQNVNKVATAVQLRFDAANAPGLPERVRERALKLAGQRATKDGVIASRLAASEHRSRTGRMRGRGLPHC